MSDKSYCLCFSGAGFAENRHVDAAHERFAVVRDTFAEASQALGYDMWDLIQNGEQEALNRLRPPSRSC